MRLLLALASVLVFSSCYDKLTLTSYVDRKSFEITGATIFSQPGKITTKEIHFASGNLLGREIVIEGNIVKTGKFYTHLVLTDESGRMLIVLTKIEDAEEILKGKKPDKIKVLGTIERGKKGLPYVLAKSLLPLENGKVVR